GAVVEFERLHHSIGDADAERLTSHIHSYALAFQIVIGLVNQSRRRGTRLIRIAIIARVDSLFTLTCSQHEAREKKEERKNRELLHESLPPITAHTPRSALFGLAVSSSRSFRFIPSPLKSALLGEAPRRDRKPHGLACLRSNFGPGLSRLPKRQRFLQRALRSRKFSASESGRAGTPRKADSSERLF